MQPALQPLPNGFLRLLLWGCRLFRNGSLCSQGSWNRCKEKRLCVPDYENRTCSPCCNRCQMDFWGCSSGGAGCSGMAVCVVRAAGADAKRNGFVCPIMRTALAASVALAAKWISGAVSLGVQAVPEWRSVWSRAAGADAKRNGFVCPIMKTALAASVAAVAKWISGAASLGVQVFRNGSLCSQWQLEQDLPVLFRNQKTAVLICRNR